MSGPFQNPLTERIAAFLREIGLSIRAGAVGDDTALPGIDIEHGALVIDEAKLKYPGDVLHEAGHLAVVTPAERPAAASVTAVPRSLASAISPAISGVLLTTVFAGAPLVLCGALKIAYDLALLWSFRHIKPPEERA